MTTIFSVNQGYTTNNQYGIEKHSWFGGSSGLLSVRYNMRCSVPFFVTLWTFASLDFAALPSGTPTPGCRENPYISLCTHCYLFLYSTQRQISHPYIHTSKLKCNHRQAIFRLRNVRVRAPFRRRCLRRSWRATCGSFRSLSRGSWMEDRPGSVTWCLGTGVLGELSTWLLRD